ncbi:hypothetical protein DMJ13_21030 [halophilic archaeon]|nr:hypothetical protein DMJ13_21030 [halophilic archaeon]
MNWKYLTYYVEKLKLIYYRKIQLAIKEVIHHLHSTPEIAKTVLIGSLLWGYGIWLIITSFIAMGYFIQWLEYLGKPDSEQVNGEAPSFRGWTQLLSDGIRAYFIWSVYLFIALVGSLPTGLSNQEGNEIFFALLSSVFGAGIFQLLFNLQSRVEVLNTVDSPTVTFSTLFSPKLLLFLLAMYTAPAALISYSRYKSVGKGFDFKEIRTIVKSPDYAFRWIPFMLLWFVSAVTMILPGNRIADLVLFSETGIVVRELVEFVRGFISFCSLLIAYIFIGLSRPEEDQESVAGVLLQYAASTRFYNLFRRSDESIKTILVSGIIIAFGSLPSAIFMGGYLTRVLRQSESEQGRLPTFNNPLQLIYDGVVICLIWIPFALIAYFLLSLVGHVYFYWVSEDVIFSVNYIYLDYQAVWNMVSFIFSSILGVPLFGKDMNNIISIDIMSDYVQIFIISETSFFTWGIFNSIILPVMALFSLVGLSVLFFTPAAFTVYSLTNNLRSALNIKVIIKIVLSKSYVWNWILAVFYWSLIVVVMQIWNAWSLSLPGSDFEPLVYIPQTRIPLFGFPTNRGLMNSTVLFLFSLAVFYLFIESYIRIGSGVDESIDDK